MLCISSVDVYIAKVSESYPKREKGLSKEISSDFRVFLRQYSLLMNRYR